MVSAPSPQTVSALLILTAVFHGLAVIVTSFRLWFRYHIRRLWWDDFWAALTLVSDAVCMVVQWTLTAPLDHPYTNIEALPTPSLSRNAHVTSYWLNILFYTCTIWFARISIACSLIRIVPPARGVSMTASVACGVFVSMWIFLLVSKVVVCAVDESWFKTRFFIACPVPHWVAISEVCTDVVSDVILVALPIRLLWRVKLPSNEKIMILSVFSTSILVSVISAVHTIYIIPRSAFISGATAEMEGATSLIVCNLLVIVTFVYRTLKNGRDITSGPSGGKQGSSNRLTTVDLDITAGSVFSSETSMGTATTNPSSTAFTATSFSGTNVSSVVFANTGDNKSSMFGSFSEVLPPPPPPHMMPAVAISTYASQLPARMAKR